MNRIQRYARELVAANNDVADRPGVALIWRGQAIERLAATDEERTHGDDCGVTGDEPRNGDS